MKPDQLVSRYSVQHRGDMLLLEIYNSYFDSQVIKLTVPGDDLALGHLRAAFELAEREIFIHRIWVNGHHNSASARNPNPGVGRLLMFVACQMGLALGATRVSLDSLQSAKGFYTRMGMRAAEESVMALRGHPVHEGKLDPRWLERFDFMFRNTRTGGTMISDIGTLLTNIQGAVCAQWTRFERASGDAAATLVAACAPSMTPVAAHDLWISLRHDLRGIAAAR